jgi:hypothetical protein
MVVLCAGVAAAAVLVGYCSWNATPPDPPDPIPNGYADLVAAGHMVQGADPDVRHATAETLRQFVATHSAALERARLGLTRQCRMPAVALSGDVAYGYHVDDLGTLKNLTWAFAAEGRLADLEGRPMDAAASYLTSITVGIELSHGGALIDSVVGDACEAIGLDGLGAIVPKLNAAQSHQTEQQLEKLLAQLEPKSEILRHEAMFSRKLSFGPTHFFYGFFYAVGRRIFPAWRQPQERALAKYDTQHHRLLAAEIHLAARAYELEQGRKAQGWGDLVPAYLKAIPQDPLTGGAFNMTGN